MLKQIKLISLSVCAMLVLQACHDDGYVATSDAPKQLLNINSTVYGRLRADPGANKLFEMAGKFSGITNPADYATGKEPCQVKLHKMSYDTIGGAGEATTSTGALMIPHGTDPKCTGPRPVVLYAHGTSADRSYDLSKIILDQTNPANAEGAVMLAFYASQGYVVIAPNYAGYADSALSYHPYADEKQQTTEMLDALSYVRKHADNLGADLSSKLFVTGVSQGGYVSMATHKALEAKGETVTASTNISGPYALGKFLDSVMAGHVNVGATTFAPMYLTALQRAHSIYENPSEVFAAPYAYDVTPTTVDAENILPQTGKSSGFDAGLPEYALFSAAQFATDRQLADAPSASYYGIGYGTDHLLADEFRENYLAALDGSNVVNASYKVRELAHEADLQDWTPKSRLAMCGTSSDPIVYHDINSGTMETYWSNEVASGLVSNLDLDGSGTGIFADVQAEWNTDLAFIADVHSTTGSYCAGAGMVLFNTM